MQQPPKADRNGDRNNAVCVAVRVRPQSARERAEKVPVCVSITPGVPQIVIGQNKAFTYDHVFAESTNQKTIYSNCVHGLLDGLFDGYNATVLAYGQTGSGKTYTMGTSFESANQLSPDSTDEYTGIIPRAAKHLFDGIESRKRQAKESGHLEPTFEVNVQFVELYNEEIIDLLADVRTASAVRNAAIKIQEDPVHNEIYLRGAVWRPVQSSEDIMNALRAGALNRTTAATNMNQQSSRSHAIFTVQLMQQRVVTSEVMDSEEDSDQSNNEEHPQQKAMNATISEMEMLHAKFHFVDLAGSERLKRTGATGDRAKEGISINSGLLALGNVISALGGGSGKVTHVPYRDSKLTRLLQDSLGGNSRTLMIACASPSDLDSVETLNTLNYANRAKNIKNKVVANQDKSGKLITELRARIEELEKELQEYKQGKRMVGEDGEELINDQYLENMELQSENNRLVTRVKALDGTVDVLRARNVALQTAMEMAKLRAGEGQDNNKENGEESTASDQQIGTMIGQYLQEIETLNAKLIETESANEELRKQNQRYRVQAEQGGGTAAASLQNSPYATGHSVPTSMLIQTAKSEIARQKKVLHDATVKADGSPKQENDEASDQSANEEGHDSMEEEEMRRSLERKRIHDDLAQLQEDINVKEQLIIQLELSQRRLDQLRQDYERKLGELGQRILATEAERDQILEQMTTSKDPKQTKQQEDDIKKVREKYEKRLADMRTEHRRLELAERENKKNLVQQNKQQSELGRIRQEMENMKRQKVDLMHRLKEENKRIREIQTANARKLATYEKTSRQQQNQIQRLMRDAMLKDENLKRKMEEVQRLKNEQKSRRRTIYQPRKAPKNLNVEDNDPCSSSASQQTKGASAYSKFNTTFIVDKPILPPLGVNLPNVSSSLLNLSQVLPSQRIGNPTESLVTISSVPTDEEEEEKDDEDMTFVGNYLQKLHCHSAVGHNRAILSLHATGEKMISGSKDRSAKVWDLESGEHLMTLGNHPNNVLFVHLLPDDHMALTSSLNIVKVWDLRAPIEQRCVHHLNSMGIVDEGLNTPCDRTTAMPKHETDIRCAAVDPQQQRFLFTTCKNGIRVWDLHRMEHIGLFGDPSANADIMQFSVYNIGREANHDENVSPSEYSLLRVASVTAKSPNISLFDNLRIQTAAVGTPRGSPSPLVMSDFHQLTAHEGLITSLCFSPKALFTASKDLSLMRFSMLDLKRDHVQPLAHGQEKIQAMCPLSQSSGGEDQLLATGSRDGTLKVWDVGTTNRIHCVETLASAHPKLNTMCANSHMLFTGSSENTVLYWRIV